MDRALIAATDVDMARRIPVKRQEANPASAAGYQRHEWAIRSAAGVLGFRGFLVRFEEHQVGGVGRQRA
jgi:hypothetical protein